MIKHKNLTNKTKNEKIKGESEQMKKQVEQIIDQGNERRSRTKMYLSFILVFVAVCLFTFLTQRFKDNDSANAANPWAFDAGYIMSDWQMARYNSMSEADIQNFLTSKNPCNNRDRALYNEQSSKYPGVSWHWSGDHFVCLSEERFGNGTTIGSGETAAHIIWQAAQDYKINPQVLIVLLEKENGLITDTFPHSGQYKTATGFACPDTGPCDPARMGFKNQIRLAAALFREVLDGGWSSYPMGVNYVQYHPNMACGGTMLNIRNRATSALYRYTPYQPNNSALAAGYGTGDGCASYGNRNFYLWFEDWFGGTTREDNYTALGEPREMQLKHTTDRINPDTGEVVDTLEAGMIRKYVTKTTLSTGEMCLRTEHSTNNDKNECIKFSDLGEVYVDFDNPRYMKVVGDNSRIDVHNNSYFDTLENGRILMYTSKINKNGTWYYRTEHMTNTNEDIAMEASHIQDLQYLSFDNPRYMKLSKDVKLFDPYTGQEYETLRKGEVMKFSTKIYTINGWNYRTDEFTNDGTNKVIPSDAIEEMPTYERFITPRNLILTQDTDRINPYTGKKYDTLEKGRILKYTSKIFIDGVWYYRTEHMTNNKQDVVVPSSATGEVL